MAHIMVPSVATALLILLVPLVQFAFCEQRALVKSPRKTKGYDEKKHISNAIRNSPFLKILYLTQMDELIDNMTLFEIAKGQNVTKEGDKASFMYVSQEGEFNVLKNGKVEEKFGPGRAFGEVEAIYGMEYTEMVQAVNTSKVWGIEREELLKIIRPQKKTLEENVKLLQGIPLLSKLSEYVLSKITFDLQMHYFLVNETIVHQGDRGQKLFIIIEGQVRVVKLTPGETKVTIKRTLGHGDYFGENALLKRKCYSASVQVESVPGVKILTLCRSSKFIDILRPHIDRDYGEKNTTVVCNES